jgi:glycosyltransferase involved in cell wall biosynthesis
MEISVVIHTLNSGKTIRQCLESVKDFDEIIICDMFSDDDTLVIANEYGVKVVMHERCNGIPEPARTFAVNRASKDWVLVVDSDEVVPEELKKYLYGRIEFSDTPDALFVPRKNFFMNKYVRASFPDYQLRFFRREKFVKWPVNVHSRPEIDGNIGKIPKKISLAFIHLEENGISPTVSKMNSYSDREIERRKNEKENVIGLIFKPLYRFVQSYFIKGGFLDGKEGLIYATLRGYYKYLTIAKIIESQNKKNPIQD